MTGEASTGTPDRREQTSGSTAARVAIAGGVVALLVGGFSWWVDQLSWMGIPERTPEYVAFGALQVLGNAPTLWVLGGAAVGVAAGRIGLGALAGTAALVLAVGVYYALIVVFETRPGAELGRAVIAWMAVAVLAGPVVGAAGGAISEHGAGRRWIGAGVLGAALIGIGAFALEWSWPVAVVHVAGGMLVAAIFGGARRPAAVALAILLGAAAGGLTQLAFQVVWSLLRS